VGQNVRRTTGIDSESDAWLADRESARQLRSELLHAHPLGGDDLDAVQYVLEKRIVEAANDRRE
jgi:hypothetical protein